MGVSFVYLEVKVFVSQFAWRYDEKGEGDIDTRHDPVFELIRLVNLYVTTRKQTLDADSAHPIFSGVRRNSWLLPSERR